MTRRFAFAIALALVLLAAPSASRAQGFHDGRVDDRVERRPLDREQLGRLDRFLDDHPEVAHDLRSNPWIVNDRRYLADHPGFRDFLGDHPTIREELQQNPRAVLSQEHRFDHHEEHQDLHGEQHHDWHGPQQHPQRKHD